jgi:hypothetical protein
MSEFEGHPISRCSSVETIPDVNFLVQSVEADLKGAAVDVTEFKKMELRGDFSPEPLLAEDKTRFVLFPIKHCDVSPLLA